jgi:ubiquinone/menaquinone biosynthesis C-methylase UbiE
MPNELRVRIHQYVSAIIVRYIPTRYSFAIKRFVLRMAEMRAAKLGARNSIIPPASKTFIYGVDPDFKLIGAEFLKHLTELGGLKPDHKVLDIGCGIGRIALSLADYLSREGEYWGFDIIRAGIMWCRENITPRRPDFHFEAVDICNKTYNPNGKYSAADFKFPYRDDYFDFVYTASVFTHMLPADLENYLAESARVMKRGGRCLHTFFLINDEALSLMGQGKAVYGFVYKCRGYFTVSRVEPEKAVAYEEAYLRALYHKCGLKIIEPIHYGNWCGRKEYLSGQDIVVAEKT